MKIQSPGKINLWLRIKGLRPDGYHLIESGMAPIDLFDEMNLEDHHSVSRTDAVIFIRGSDMIQIDNDTISKALRLFRQVRPQTPCLKVTVQKNIPMGAGLGGGSANAAQILRALQIRYGHTGSASSLPKIAEQIGADVPFFLQMLPAVVSGIGENIQPVRMEELNLLIVKPPFSVSSRDAYHWFDQRTQLTPLRSDVNSSAADRLSEEPLTARRLVEQDFLVNDLEEPVGEKHPEIQNVKKALSKWGALGSLMSGSGSSVFGIFESVNEATVARDKLQHHFSSGYSFFICKTLI